MASKRMFDRAIIDTDKFMDMSMSAKALYFLLGMEADDEGFVSFKKVMRVHGGNEDDLRILAVKNLIIPFQSGVVVITDWHKNNYLDKNRMKPTEYQFEKSLLLLTDTDKYELNKCSTSIEEYSIEEKRKKDDSAKASSSSLHSNHTVSGNTTQGEEGPNHSGNVTFEEYLEEYQKTEIYGGEDMGMVEAYIVPGLKSPQTREKMQRRYLGRLKGQSAHHGASRPLKQMSSVWLHFVERCEKELGTKPVASAKNRSIIESALKHLSKDEIFDLLDEWFAMNKPVDETIQITRALSNYQINGYKARNV